MHGEVDDFSRAVPAKRIRTLSELKLSTSQLGRRIPVSLVQPKCDSLANSDVTDIRGHPYRTYSSLVEL